MALQGVAYPAGVAPAIDVDADELRRAIRAEYEVVALRPEVGLHFQTGRPLAALLGYEAAWLAGLPESSIVSFAGTGHPFAAGLIAPGEHVVDIGHRARVSSARSALRSVRAVRGTRPSGWVRWRS